jgi:glucose-6-phosphate 1-dehydrogenase
MANQAAAEPCLFVVFGATGDLNERKLLPALARLAERGLLKGSHVLGVARSSEMNDQLYRRMARGIVGASAMEWCDACVHYRSLGDSSKERLLSLATEIQQIEQRYHLPGNRVFYLALPPEAFAPTVDGIGTAGLQNSAGWTRIVVEKPFGHDLESAQKLNAMLHSYFDESQIYRIDHYLGKETVQNLLVFRFANPIFESLWNRNHIEHVQITVAEQLGVEGRAAYYDRTGALRDMVQNHLTQVLSLIAMEVPAHLEPEQIRDEKAKVLQSIAPIQLSDVVFGQYVSYRSEPGVAKDSHTETAVALRLNIVNWRWNGVPFYLRTGKCFPKHSSEIAITFRRAPVSVFEPFGAGCNVENNVLLMSIQPDESFKLRFQVKIPGQPVRLTAKQLEFRYSEQFESIPDGYETLLQDILAGEQSLFVRADWIENSWRLYDPLLKSPHPVFSYERGTWGPPEMEQLSKLRPDSH